MKKRAITGFIVLIILIATTDVAVLLDIPVLRQGLGFLVLTFLPGLIILFLLRLDKLGLAEKLALSVGISIAFLMLFGWLTNQLCLAVGFMTPLSTTSVICWLSAALIILSVLAYIRNKEAFSSFPFHFELNTRAKLLLLLPAIFPILSFLGTHLLNTSDNNVILLVFLFLVPVSVILITFARDEVSRDMYPIALVMITVALLSMWWLRWQYWGYDNQQELYIFHETLSSSHWALWGYSTYDSCLTISLLPSIYQSLLNINLVPQYLFKGLPTLVLSFTPLVIYIISKRYIRHQYAFLAAFFFMSQGAFLYSAINDRTMYGVFFFAVSVMVLFSRELQGVNQRLLFITFIVSGVVSHYSSTLVFFFILLLSGLLIAIFRKYVTLRAITPAFIALFFALIFLWYSQLTEVPFRLGVLYFNTTFKNLGYFFFAEMKSPSMTLLVGSGLGERGVLEHIHFVITWLSFAFIAVGVIGAITRFRQMITTPQSENSKAEFLKEKFEVTYVAMALVCSGLLLGFLTLPYVSLGYSPDRTFCLTLPILSSFLIIGGILISKYLRLSSRLLILALVISYFIFFTGWVYEVAGVHKSDVLSSETEFYDYVYTHDEEVQAAQFIKEHTGEEAKIHALDSMAGYRLVGQAMIPFYRVDVYGIIQYNPHPGYVYLSYYNAAEGKVPERDNPNIQYSLAKYLPLLANDNKIYDNGGSELYLSE